LHWFSPEVGFEHDHDDNLAKPTTNRNHKIAGVYWQAEFRAALGRPNSVILQSPGGLADGRL
jgi:hypothetical protein